MTHEELQRRKNYLGASDMAAVLGLSPWKSAYDVWAEKIGLVDGSPDNDAMKAGRRFEVAVLDEAEERLGALERNIWLPSPDASTPLASTLDARLVDGGVPVEAKTAGLFGVPSTDWGDDGTDEVPQQYLVQVHVQMLCTGRDLAHLAAFIGGRGFAFFRVQRSTDVISCIVDEARRFWKDNVLTKVAPANSAPSPETFKKLRREPKSIVQIDAGTVEQWRVRRADCLEAEKLEKESYGQVMAALGTAECGELPDGGRVTFLEQRGAPVCDTKALRAELPEVAAKYVRENSFRVLRFREAK